MMSTLTMLEKVQAELENIYTELLLGRGETEHTAEMVCNVRDLIAEAIKQEQVALTER